MSYKDKDRKCRTENTKIDSRTLFQVFPSVSFFFFLLNQGYSPKCVWAPSVHLNISLSHLFCVADAQVVPWQPGANLTANPKAPFVTLLITGLWERCEGISRGRFH